MSTHLSKTTRLILPGLILSCLCGAASAGPSLSLQAGAWRAGDSQDFQDQGAHQVAAHDAGNTDAGGGLVLPYVIDSAASGSVTGGVMKVNASTQFSTGPLAGSASAYGQWSDVFWINAPDLAVGTMVQIHYSFQLAASLAVSYGPLNGPGAYDNSMAYSRWSLSHYLGNTSNPHVDLSERKDVLANGTLTTSSLVNGVPGTAYGRFDITGTAAVGMPIYLYTGLLAQTFVGDGRTVASGSGSADLGNSLYWGGLDSVRLLDGSNVTYSISSQSGTNYGQSFVPGATVPEPGTLALLCESAAAMLLVARRRRASGAKETSR